jgi:hypothetical protein
MTRTMRKTPSPSDLDFFLNQISECHKVAISRFVTNKQVPAAASLSPRKNHHLMRNLGGFNRNFPRAQSLAAVEE